MPLIASGLALVQAALASLGSGNESWWQSDPLIMTCGTGIIALAMGNAALCVLFGLVYVPRRPLAHRTTLAVACGSWLLQVLLIAAGIGWCIHAVLADSRYAERSVAPTVVLGFFSCFLLTVQVRLIRAYRRYGGPSGAGARA